jgi:hypothetical protein
MGESTVTARRTRTEVVRFEITPNGTTDVRASDLLTELVYVARRVLTDMENAAEWIRSFDQDGHAMFLAEQLETSRQSLLPFSTQTARKLMAIGADRRLSKGAHVRDLPPSWGTLYELTKLDDETWGIAEERGLIRPDVEAKAAEAMDACSWMQKEI